MGYLLKSVGVLSMTVLLAGVAMAEEKDPLKPRVPPDQMADAKAMRTEVDWLVLGNLLVRRPG